MLSYHGSLSAVLLLLSAIPIPDCSQDILMCGLTLTHLTRFGYVGDIFPLCWNPSSVPGASLYGSVKPHLWVLVQGHGAGCCAAVVCEIVPEDVSAGRCEKLMGDDVGHGLSFSTQRHLGVEGIRSTWIRWLSSFACGTGTCLGWHGEGGETEFLGHCYLKK